MYKVTITGINTSELKTLSNEEMISLLRQVKENNQEARERLVEGNLKLVLSILKRFRNKKESMDDLFQVGVIGLMKAIDHFNPDLNVMFSTYAVPMIMGEIKRYLRDNSMIRVSRSLKDIAYKTISFKEQFIMQEHREPTVQEISNALDVDPIDIIMALDAILDPISIYTPIYDNGADTIELQDQISSNENIEEKNVMLQSLRDAFQSLNEREKSVIKKRYFENQTQLEIATDLNISQAQVSRIEKNALLQMKRRMES